MENEDTVNLENKVQGQVSTESRDYTARKNIQVDYASPQSPILDVGKVGDSEMAIDMRSGDSPVAKTLLYKDL